MKTSMTVERLRQVVRVLEGLPEDAGFDMEKWYCATSACAIGWAAQDPWFTRRGLKLEHTGWPVYRGEVHFPAVEKFFGLEQSDAAKLFGLLAYKRGSSRLAAIRRVNAFCNKLERVSQ